ncbi:hypothetical protein RUM43_013733 [Polyplax serrata]|uniref:Adenylyltransferase and sulfurtransferase MOCS3 homolog n=1 Tax=Polyplax serrata TaxID=468196 RepID=A0AAN8NX84_POLSC
MNVHRLLKEELNVDGVPEGGRPLSNQEISRYSRQILLPDIGVEGQILLRQSSVLIVGAGGLGCPSSVYLAGSGVGHIGLVDYDDVEVNNLHRQILHTTNTVKMKKVESAGNFLKSLNPMIKVSIHPVLLDTSNAFDIISKYNVVIDATDNVVTRYLLNDACVMLGKPLISGSALQMEGQLTIYNYKNGPCYRCLFPVPPPPETVNNCSDSGVLGVIPGIIGVLQALEAIKLILNQETMSGKLLLFSGTDTSFRKIKLRDRNINCAVCGNNPTIKKLIDYEQFCNSKSNDKYSNLSLLPTEKRVSAQQYSYVRESPHILIDVRYKQEFKICKLDNSLNIPIDQINSVETFNAIQKEINNKQILDVPIFVICRRGNDSQKAVIELDKKFPNIIIKDIIGGLHAWSQEVDTNFPIY